MKTVTLKFHKDSKHFQIVWPCFTKVPVGSPGRQMPLALQLFIKNNYMTNPTFHILTLAIVDTYWAANRHYLCVECLNMFLYMRTGPGSLGVTTHLQDIETPNSHSLSIHSRMPEGRV